MNTYIRLLIYTLLLHTCYPAPEHCNLFEPYEWLFDPVRLGITPSSLQWGYNFAVRVEQSCHVNGFISDDDDCFCNPLAKHKRKLNPLQYLEDAQNVYAAFLGTNVETPQGSFIQQFTPYSGVTANGLACVTGKVAFGNVVGSFEWWVSECLRLGWYVPYYWMSLHDTCWRSTTGTCLFEQTLNTNFLNNLPQSSLNIGNFNRSGIGDSTLLLSWQDSFIEKRDFITGITCALRSGIILPTRTDKSDQEAENSLLRIRWGYDSSWAIIVGGSLGIDLGCFMTLGVSADCTKLFGDVACRRIKTDIRQTDLLLPTKTQCFIDPGFKQQFVLYTDFHNFSKSLVCTTAYYYAKQQASDIILCSAQFPHFPAASMQRLEAWSSHNLILQLQATREGEIRDWTSGVFVKWGVSGERSLEAVTLGASLACTF